MTVAGVPGAAGPPTATEDRRRAASTELRPTTAGQPQPRSSGRQRGRRSARARRDGRLPAACRTRSAPVPTGSSARSAADSAASGLRGDRRRVRRAQPASTEISGLPTRALAGLAVQHGHGAGVRGGHLHHGLGRLHLGDRLVHADLVAHGHEPVHEFGFGEAFAEVRQEEYFRFRSWSVFPLEVVNGVEDAVHAGQVVVLELRRRVGHVEAGDAADRRGRWWKQRSWTRATISEAHRREAVGLGDHHGAAGLADRGADGLVVERHDGADVDDFQRAAFLGRGRRGGRAPSGRTGRRRSASRRCRGGRRRRGLEMPARLARAGRASRSTWSLDQ